jgi:quercetin dioxygenase-like cupin family protein
LETNGSNESVTIRPDRTGHLLNGVMEKFSLNEVVEWLQNEADYREKGHNALTLVKNYPKSDPSWDKNKGTIPALAKAPGLRTVVVCLQKGHSLPEHNAPGRFTLTMLQGQIRFILEPQAQNVSTELAQGELLVLEEPLSHEVQAIEDSAFLLTIAFTKAGPGSE